ncbi:flavin reductase family protein [Hirschia litorea]|uniref:Flavin reductase family protein n=1 Tax=Hirschia litorea TaxID=1199156 RepID=A0ABW2INT5_9PROT
MANFSPKDNGKAFRTALSRFSTGVTIVTANTPAGPIGITANSFSSLSLLPPLIMWAPAKCSTRYDAFINASHFAVHVLTFAQKNICHAFASNKDSFQEFPHYMNDENVPILENCLATFECKTHNIHDAGDHSIVIGQVYLAHQQEGEALIFSQGQFIKAKST